MKRGLPELLAARPSPRRARLYGLIETVPGWVFETGRSVAHYYVHGRSIGACRRYQYLARGYTRDTGPYCKRCAAALIPIQRKYAPTPG